MGLQYTQDASPSKPTSSGTQFKAPFRRLASQTSLRSISYINSCWLRSGPRSILLTPRLLTV